MPAPVVKTICAVARGGGGFRGGAVRLGALEAAQLHLAASEWQGLAAGLDLRGWGLRPALIVMSELSHF